MTKFWMLLPFLAVILLHGNTLCRAATPSFEDFNRRGLNGEALSVVFFGGSLTWGANASDPQTTSYRGLMAQYLQAKYPKASFAFRDAAIGGTGSALGMFRMQRDVLAYKPDLVFLDFTANDDLFIADLPTLGSYETLLREMVGRGIPVVQVFMGFRSNFGSEYNLAKLPRYREHHRLAQAYHTGVGDVFPYVQEKVAAGAADLQKLWPFDGTHPDDAGYRLFFEAVRDGFDRAVLEKRCCIVPKEPVFASVYRSCKRARLAEGAMPQGWQVSKTLRTSMWYDGLTSRWMGDVAVCDARDKAAAQPLKIPFEGSFVAIFGERTGNSLGFRVKIDGKAVEYRANAKSEPTPVWPTDTRLMGGGNLFYWTVLKNDLTPGAHELEIEPVFDDATDSSKLRIESVCSAQ